MALLEVNLVRDNIDIGEEATNQIAIADKGTSKLLSSNPGDGVFSTIDHMSSTGQVLYEIGSPLKDVLDKVEIFMEVIDEVSKVSLATI